MLKIFSTTSNGNSSTLLDLKNFLSKICGKQSLKGIFVDGIPSINFLSLALSLTFVSNVK